MAQNSSNRVFARFGCNECAAAFHSQHGDSESAKEWRCEACDYAELRSAAGKNVDEAVCPHCAGVMKPGLDPMCPRCGSRDVLVIVPGMFFD